MTVPVCSEARSFKKRFVLILTRVCSSLPPAGYYHTVATCIVLEYSTVTFVPSFALPHSQFHDVRDGVHVHLLIVQLCIGKYWYDVYAVPAQSEIHTPNSTYIIIYNV